MQQTSVALITGANKGIGFQIAKDLLVHGFTVLIGSRSLENGRNAAKALKGDAHAIEIDVTKQNTINSAAERIRQEFGRLDVLVNNAGISHAGKPGEGFPENAMQYNLMTDAPLEHIRTVWETNVFGVISVTQSMLSLLREAPAARIVNIGSTGGSLSWNSELDNPHRAMFGNYSASKSASHAVSLAFACALENSNIKVNIACPGHTATALNNYSGSRTVEEAARAAVRLALLGKNGPNGSFSDENGLVAW